MDAEPSATPPAETARTVAQTAVPVTRTEFHFERTGAPWHLLAWLALAIALVWWAWRRYGPAPAGVAGRIARLCRAAAMVVLVAMLAGPAWRTTATTEVPGRVLIAVDRSASMARSDGPDGAPRIAAATTLQQALATADRRRLALDWQALGGVAGTIAPEELAAGLAATGATSPLGEELLRLVEGGRYDAVVLLSDGRVTAGERLEAVADALRRKDLAVYALAVGTEAVEPGLWIDTVVANASAALEEREPVVVRVGGRGLGPGPVVVRVLVDGKEQAKRELTLPQGTGDAGATAGDVTLEVQFAKQGTAALRVEVEQDGRRDARDLRVEVAERKLQVLVLDSRPRYEIRYLREALRRDHTIELHAYLHDGRRWRRWSNQGPDDHLPLSKAEARDYDVILLGDLGPDLLGEEHALAIDEAVRKHGTGLVWLLGELGATAGFANHKLGGLLPTRLPSAEQIARGFVDNQGRRIARTPGAAERRLFESGEIPWERLPELAGAAPLGEPLPAAEVLMQDQDGQAVVVARDYGPGRAVLVGVDDTWRWRRNVGDTYLQRFHGQLLRFAAANRRHGARTWRLGVQPRRAVPGEVVTVQLGPLGAKPDSPPDRATAALVAPDGRQVVVALTPDPDGGGFTARVPAPAAGAYRVIALDGPAAKEVEEGELEVVAPASEVRDPRADRAALTALARSTGGTVASDPAALVAALPDVSRDHVETLPPRGLWDTAWALALLVTLLAVDWAIRRWNRLP